MICDEIVSWVSTCRDTLEQSSKTCSAGLKTPKYSQNRVTNYDFRQNRLLGISVSRYTETHLKNVLSRSKKLPGSLKFALQTTVCDQIVSPEHQRVYEYQKSLQKRATRIKKIPGTVKTKLQTMVRDKIVSRA